MHLDVWPLELGIWTHNPHTLTRRFIVIFVVMSMDIIGLGGAMGPPFIDTSVYCCTSPGFVFGARFATALMASCAPPCVLGGPIGGCQNCHSSELGTSPK